MSNKFLGLSQFIEYFGSYPHLKGLYYFVC